MAEPIIITYNCRVITHMFAGGALSGDYTELNPKTFKNLLSYWWRATQFDTTSENVYKKQTHIFGGGGADSLKSMVSIKIINLKRAINQESLDFNNNENSGTLKYITYGIKPQKNNSYRYVFLGTQFTVQINLDTNRIQRLINVGLKSEFDLINELNLAMYAFSLIGGLGAKTRNGFGHFHIQSFSVNNSALLNIMTLESLLKKFDKIELAKYTTITKNAQLYSLKSNKSNNILSTSKIFEFGKAYKESISTLEKLNKNCKRRYISLPRKGIDPPPTRHSRLIFFTVVVENGQNKGYLVYLPYLYLSNGGEQNEFKTTNENLIDFILQNNKNS